MITIGVLTISDSGAIGARQDTSGEKIREMVTQLPEAVISAGAIIPDERELIEATLCEWSDDKHLNLIITTGGTGLAPRDITPEATMAVIDREAPGIGAHHGAEHALDDAVEPGGVRARRVAQEMGADHRSHGQ